MAVKTSIREMKHNVDISHLALLFFTARTKAEMFQFRIWTINQTASLGKLLSTEKSYLDTYRDETHLIPLKLLLRLFFALVLFFSHLTISHGRWEGEKIVCSLVIN